MAEAMMRSSDEPPMPKVFIVGCGRSGTTWVRSILSQHSEVVSGPESHLFPVLYPALSASDNPSRRRERVLAAFDARVNRRGEFGNTGPHRWISRSGLESLVRSADARALAGDAMASDVIGGILEGFFIQNGKPGSRIVVEKTPRHLMYADRILTWWPEARVIEVVRDGRDVCVSLAHMSREFSWAPPERNAQIQRWVTAIRRGIDLRRTTEAHGRWHVVRYEDLSANPISEIRSMYRFIGLAADGDLASEVAQATAFANVRRPKNAHHLRNGKVGSWRREFSSRDQAEFERLAGDLLSTLGYEH